MADIIPNKKLRIRRILLLLMVLLVALSSLYVYIDFRLKKIVLDFAKSEAKTILLSCANDAALTVLNSSNVSYEDIAVISRNLEGLVTSVEINTTKVNRFKSLISEKTTNALKKQNFVTFKLPIFAAFGCYYSAFYIPNITYRIELTTTAITDFNSKFYSAGINQVLHQILVNINLESNLSMPFCDSEIKTQTSLIAAETVIVGVVPEAFTEVINADDELVGDIFDYSAEANNGGKNGF